MPPATPKPPTAEELAEVGVEITEPPAPLGRAKFTEAKMPQEPGTDRRLTLDDGTKLRERIVQTDASVTGVLATQAAVSPTGVTLTVSLAELDENDVVKKDADGRVRLAPAHEIMLTGENMARLGSEREIEARIKEIREEAADRARKHFKGLDMLNNVLGGRVIPAHPRNQQE